MLVSRSAGTVVALQQWQATEEAPHQCFLTVRTGDGVFRENTFCEWGRGIQHLKISASSSAAFHDAASGDIRCAVSSFHRCAPLRWSDLCRNCTLRRRRCRVSRPQLAVSNAPVDRTLQLWSGIRWFRLEDEYAPDPARISDGTRRRARVQQHMQPPDQ